MALPEAIGQHYSAQELYQQISNWAAEMKVEKPLMKAILNAADRKPADYIRQQGWVPIAAFAVLCRYRFPGDDFVAGHAGDSAAHIRRQEVMNGPVPPAHAGADGFLLDVLAESCTLLGQLGVEGSGDVAHGVQGALVPFEEHLLGVFTEETT